MDLAENAKVEPDAKEAVQTTPKDSARLSKFRFAPIELTEDERNGKFGTDEDDIVPVAESSVVKRPMNLATIKDRYEGIGSQDGRPLKRFAESEDVIIQSQKQFLATNLVQVPKQSRNQSGASTSANSSGGGRSGGCVSAASLVDISKYEEIGGGGKLMTPEEEEASQIRKAKYRCASARVMPLPRPDSTEDGEPASWANSYTNRSPYIIPIRQNPLSVHAHRPPLGVNRVDSTSSSFRSASSATVSLMADERLKHLEPSMVELIMSEILDHQPEMRWTDIAGLDGVKQTLKEIIVLPMLKPELFTGLRAPAKGVLLFGPPGNGKTLIAKCIANQSKATFFNISAASLTSKWVGDGEKMVRTLFTVAQCKQPAVIFIDEVDSLLSQRTETDHDATRKLKTELLVQLDGVATRADDRVLIIGATNRPKEIDEAARRRFIKRLYVGLPDESGREAIIRWQLRNNKHSVTDAEFKELAELTAGFSGADVATLCKDAAMGPIRSILDIEGINSADELRPITFEDFRHSLKEIRPSVSDGQIADYLEFDRQFGSGNARNG